MEEKEIYINDNNYRDFINLPVVAFSFAHGGAMGCGGEIIAITKDAKIYCMNYCYDNITIEKCGEVCPPLQECIFGFFRVEQTPEGWKGVSLGMGNFLILSEPLYVKLKPQIVKFAPHELYGRWLRMVVESVKKG